MSRLRTAGAVVVLILVSLGIPVMAANQQGSVPQPMEGKARKGPTQAERRLAKLVREEMELLPTYTVFDFLNIQVSGHDVELLGQVRKESLKSDAASTLSKIEGVGKVINKIEILPASPSDDHIRRMVFQAIYQHPTLSRYGMQAVPPIHIIVIDGKVFLKGSLTIEMDKTIAEVQASSVPGVISVTNNLVIEKTN